MATKYLQGKGLFLALWITVGIIGYSVGFPAGLTLGGTLIWGWIIGGILVGIFQYLLIRRQIARSAWWIFTSVVGLITGTGISMLVSQIAIHTAGLIASFILVGASIGLGLGLGQWIVLRLQFRLAAWWVAISTVGYALGLLAAVNTPLDIPLITSLAFGPEFGGTLGIVSRVITGLGLIWQMRQSKPDLSVGM